LPAMAAPRTWRPLRRPRTRKRPTRRARSMLRSRRRPPALSSFHANDRVGSERMTSIGRVVDVVRYPVKLMAGLPIGSAHLGFHGIAGHRRFAFRRVGDNSGFPFLTASRFPELLTYQP